MKRILNGVTRAALYARVSTEEQAQHGVSLDAQKERLVRYAEENNLTIVGTYVDEGISARKRYTRRPAFMKMISDVKEKKIDVILFIKLDRWFRNVADYYEVQSILDRYNVQWIATEEDYDTTTANGRLSLNIKLAIAQDEADRTSERIKFVFGNMVREGRVISGTAPKGYRIENKRPVVDEEMAIVVRAAFEKMADCRSMKKTQLFIKEKFGILWGLKEIKHILTNPWYIGEGYGIVGYCPVIVDRSLFDLVGQIISVRSARYDGTRSDRVYLFTGLVVCGSCGRRMTTYSCSNRNKEGKKTSTFIYYRCPAHLDRNCSMQKQINQDKLEQWLLDNLVSKANEYNLSLEKNKKNRPQKLLDAEKIRMKLERLKDLYISNLILKDMYEKDFAALNALLHDAEQEARDDLKPIDLDVFKGFRETYETADLTQRKAFWSRLLEKIVVTENGDYILTFNQL
jgi:DNA invertase Pin-like site-specific DNA recombinase